MNLDNVGSKIYLLKNAEGHEHIAGGKHVVILVLPGCAVDLQRESPRG